MDVEHATIAFIVIFILSLIYACLHGVFTGSVESKILKYLGKHPNRTSEQIRTALNISIHRFYKVFNGLLSNGDIDGMFVANPDDRLEGGHHLFCLTIKGCGKLNSHRAD